MNELRNQGHQVIVGGDMNVAHNEIDIARPRENDGKIGFHPDERAWMTRVTSDQWVDVWREGHPDTTDVYSYWDMVTRARERNVGWRIDYFIIDKAHYKDVVDADYLNDQMGSDHCPLRMNLNIV
jgi:exodeoxyribonuclease-3